ncbi:plant basic secretory [Pyrenophora seminiperda CCB06]|uniref:Plant basic secretory n=1 Tax=Pyrenophora seminiperda CCB06 TaxID=1302712 RepID=A0A3M7M6B1_9PLEO|nr:plant basic secretory [Pyrenophora seminiperda CCB06]
MSSTSNPTNPPAPQSSALPPSHPFNTPDDAATSQPADNVTTSSLPSLSKKVTPPHKALLRLELRDLTSNGARAFLRLVHATDALQHAVDIVLTLLYTSMPTSCIPPTRSVTLVLRDMDGVAYTTGLDLDNDHKEIHLSTTYLSSINESRQKEEIMGVLVHEMVHCWQQAACGTAPGGLIEGVADWVRLKAGYAPPHWKRHGDCTWDAGYERTGYFLEWLEEKHGEDVVRRINEALREREYDERALWHGCCGEGVEELWEKYRESLGVEDPEDGGGEEEKEDC